MRSLRTALTPCQGVRDLGGELGTVREIQPGQQETAHTLSNRAPVRNPGARGNLATPERRERWICLKPMEQEIQGVNTLAALNHPHLRNEHRH